MAKTKNPRKPKPDRRRLAEALVLKKYFDALGIEWDTELVDEDLRADFDRMQYLEKKLWAVLADRLGVKIYYGYLHVARRRNEFSSVDASVGLRLDGLIDIARRAGWLDA